MLELGQLGLVEWSIDDLKTNGAEFLCTVRRGVEKLSQDVLQRERLMWLYRGLAEFRVQIDQTLEDAIFSATESKWGALSMLRRLR